MNPHAPLAETAPCTPDTLTCATVETTLAVRTGVRAGEDLDPYSQEGMVRTILSGRLPSTLRTNVYTGF